MWRYLSVLAGAYLLLGGAMVSRGSGLSVGMGYCLMLASPLSALLYLVLRSNDLVWYSYAAYVCSWCAAHLFGWLRPELYSSLPMMPVWLVAGSFGAMLLAVCILILVPAPQDS